MTVVWADCPMGCGPVPAIPVPGTVIADPLPHQRLLPLGLGRLLRHPYAHRPELGACIGGSSATGGSLGKVLPGPGPTIEDVEEAALCGQLF